MAKVRLVKVFRKYGLDIISSTAAHDANSLLCLGPKIWTLFPKKVTSTSSEEQFKKFVNTLFVLLRKRNYC